MLSRLPAGRELKKRRQNYKESLKPYFDSKRLGELGACMKYGTLETLSWRSRTSAKDSSRENGSRMEQEGRA